MIRTSHLAGFPLTLSLHSVNAATPVDSPVLARGLKSKRACDQESWTSDDIRAEYTRPANGTQIMRAAVSGPAAIHITKARSQSFTTPMDLGFADIISLGVGLDMAEAFNDFSSRTFHVPEGQTGDVGFTPFFVCTSGTGRCNGDEVTGGICTAKTIERSDGSMMLDGIFALVVRS